jgi:hypothetical protein
MISNINKVVQESKIQEAKDKYYKLKNEYETLPERIEKSEMQYYQEGGCNLNDDTDRKRCGMEYYLDIKREERKKVFESFTDYSNDNDVNAEELSNVGIFDSNSLIKMFNKTVEGMTVDNDKCNWDKNITAFQQCNPDTESIAGVDYPKACKYNNELDISITNDYIHRKMKKELELQRAYNSIIENKIYDDDNLNGNRTGENIRKSKVDYRHAVFYDAKSDKYRNFIEILNTIYWIVFTILVVFFIYNKHYENEKSGYLVLIAFSIIPFILKPVVKFIMLNVNRHHYMDTVYTIIALGTLMLGGSLYFITSN